MLGAKLEPLGVVYRTRNRDGETNTVLVYAKPYGFKVLEGPAVNVNDPLIDTLNDEGLKGRVTAACHDLGINRS